MDNNELDLFNNNDNTEEIKLEPQEYVQPVEAVQDMAQEAAQNVVQEEVQNVAEDLVQENINTQESANEMPSYTQATGFGGQEAQQNYYNSQIMDEPKKGKKVKKEKNESSSNKNNKKV